MQRKADCFIMQCQSWTALLSFFFSYHWNNYGKTAKNYGISLSSSFTCVLKKKREERRRWSTLPSIPPSREDFPNSMNFDLYHRPPRTVWVFSPFLRTLPWFQGSAGAVLHWLSSFIPPPMVHEICINIVHVRQNSGYTIIVMDTWSWASSGGGTRHSHPELLLILNSA